MLTCRLPDPMDWVGELLIVTWCLAYGIRQYAIQWVFCKGNKSLKREDPLVTAVSKQHRDVLSQSITIIKLAKNFGGNIIEDPPNEDDDETTPTFQGQIKRKTYGFNTRNDRLDRWKVHLRAGKFPQELENPYIDKRASLSWIRKGRLSFDGERVIIAAQDQGLTTNGFKKMAKMSNNDKCRFCKEAVESPSNIMSACSSSLQMGTILPATTVCVATCTG